MDRLLSMSVFVKAADLGSFTAAAAALSLSSQMVGKHVTFLEQRLGAQLLNRTTRRQSLTPIGQAYYDRCRALLAEATLAEDFVRDMNVTPSGLLRVTAPVNFGARRVAPLVTRYLDAYPGVEVGLTLTDRYVDMAHEGFDAAIRTGSLKDSGMTARRLRSDRLIACASPAYVARRGAPASPEDLASHDCLTFMLTSGTPFVVWDFSSAGQTHSVRVRSRFQVNDGRVLASAALDGFGIILQPEAVVEDDLNAGRLVRILPKHTTPSRPMHVVFSAKRPTPLKIRYFVDMVVQLFADR